MQDILNRGILIRDPTFRTRSISRTPRSISSHRSMRVSFHRLQLEIQLRKPMESEEFPESERLQIQHIRELDAEELEVEEIDEEELSDGDNYHESAGVSTSDGFAYDTSLVALHSYLGEVEDTRHRLAFLDGGAVLTLPLFYLEGVVLFPEATLPLRVISPSLLAGVERAMGSLDAPYTICVVRLYRDSVNGRVGFSTTGSTAEIRQYRHLEDGSVNIVARGQQRFRLRRGWIGVEGALCAEVQIVLEDLPLRTPRDVVGKLAPLGNSRASIVSGVSTSGELDCHHVEGNDSDAISFGSFEGELSSAERKLHKSALFSCCSSDESSSDDEKLDLQRQPGITWAGNSMRPILFKYSQLTADTSPGALRRSISGLQSHCQVSMEKLSVRQFRDAPRAFWPSWVYHMFDSYTLARKAADRWKQVVKEPNMDNFVLKPDLLSFHIASKLPVSESSRQELLEIDGTSYRLRREIEFLDGFDKLQCKACRTLVAKRSDMLVMSSEGPLGAYANPHGFVHEVMTLMRTTSIAVTGHPVKEFSWFPGYAWSITECSLCRTHMGWYFSATNKKMRPQAFWGLRSSQVVDDVQ